MRARSLLDSHMAGQRVSTDRSVSAEQIFLPKSQILEFSENVLLKTSRRESQADGSVQLTYRESPTCDYRVSCLSITCIVECL